MATSGHLPRSLPWGERGYCCWGWAPLQTPPTSQCWRRRRSSGWCSRTERIARLWASNFLGKPTGRNHGPVARTKWTLGKCRVDAGLPAIYTITLLLARTPAVGRGLRSTGVHLVKGQHLARVGVVLAGSEAGVERRVGPVGVSHWDSWCGLGRMWIVGGRRWVGGGKAVQLSRH